MYEAVLSLGSNLGNKLENIISATKALNYIPMTKIVDISKIYETIPVEVNDIQDDYLNCCVRLETELSPNALLGTILGIEATLKRKRPFWHASRIIDIDLLLYENVSLNTKELTLPHPRMFERAFVLVPLKDLYPDFKVLGIDFKQAFNSIDTTLIKFNTEFFM